MGQKIKIMLTQNLDVLKNFADANQREWLETNGLGGWASSSVIGVNTRRYHGLLVAAIVPPTERTVLLSKLDETIVIDMPRENGHAARRRYELGVNLYQGNTVQPTGHQYLTNFSKGFYPEWTYEVEGIQLKKRIAMIHGENTVAVIYDVIKSPAPFTLELLPLIAGRGYHQLAHQGPQMHWDVNFNEGTFHNQPDGNLNVFINVPGSTYEHTPRWFRNFLYSVEQFRGLDCIEDLFNHGTLSVSLKEGDSLGIIVSTENPAGRNAHELLNKETQRRQRLVYQQPEDEIVRQLVLAADQFIVKRGENLKTVIAGYHWFTDWGRDTMISLPGLCLSTGRYEDAKKIIAAFAKSVSMGMLPNRFQDNGEEPEYNNVDGTLWYFIAVYKYLMATGDLQFVQGEILPVLKDIIDWHYKGTRYNIQAQEDNLLFAGEQGQQLTWMDARIGNWVVTPRMGKPVEIQALWYNALKIFAELLQLNNQPHDAWVVGTNAEKVKQNFTEKFWYAEGNYLYDVIDEEGDPDHTLRPNQLFAISLPFPLIEGERAGSVLKIVEDQLYTPVGLRSLPKGDPHYVPVYKGDAYERDSSYHQGTVWSWLLGPFVDALVKVKADKVMARMVISNFAYHLNEGCIGSVSEIFDAEPPHHPRGCVAQAWGVAEILRVIKDYQLYDEITETIIVETTEVVTIAN
jgi:predicted glycogen debranching enzyme